MWIIILRYVFVFLIASGIIYKAQSWFSKVNAPNFQFLFVLGCITVILCVFFKGYWHYKIAKLESNAKREKK